jgi:hypothetical protein
VGITPGRRCEIDSRDELIERSFCKTERQTEVYSADLST